MTNNISAQELSEIIGDIYDAALTAKWSGVLDKLIEMTQSNKAFFFLQELGKEKPAILEMKTTFEYPHKALIDYQSRPLEDPFYQATKVVPEGEFILCNEYVDINEHINTDYYQSIFVPLRSHYALAGVMCRDGTHESAFALTRGPEQQPYSDHEKKLFKTLTPHLSRAMHIFKELKLYKSYSNITKKILDQNEKAIIVCYANGKIVMSNQFANDKLIAPCPVFLGVNKIGINDEEIQKKLDHYIEQCSSLSYKDIGIQETIIIDNKENSDNILITVSPLANQNDFNNVSEACCLITIIFQQQLNWPILQNKFQLTAKELQLLKAIYTKKKLHQLTSVFNVSYNTLRTHLQSIFRKVGVNSQTELMVKINLFK